MSLAHGVPYLAIPGPSVLPERVLRAMHRQNENIYEGPLVDLTHGLLPKLRGVAGTQHDVAIYIGNGHAAWEAALSNVLAEGDKVLVLVTGLFARSWADMCDGLGIENELLAFPEGTPIDPAQVEARLRADTDRKIRAVLAVHTDTATGVRSEIRPVADAIEASGHDALLMADCIASLGSDPFEMDALGVDVTLSACQKGLMTPAGLAFNWIGPKALARRREMTRVSRYWDWTKRIAPDYLYEFFDGTPPSQLLYSLDEALTMIEEEGLSTVLERHARIANGVWAAAEHWGQEGALELCVPNPRDRSHAVTSLTLPNGDAKRLQDWCCAQTGLTLGLGLGRDPQADFFRIGHMGHVNASMMLGALATIEAGMLALDINHQPGGARVAAQAMGLG